MPALIDQWIQEANVLHDTALKYQDQLAVFGVTKEELADMLALRDKLVSLDVTQKEMMSAKMARTKEQNQLLTQTRKQLSKLKSIAKIVYAEQKDIWPKFHIGYDKIQTVKTALMELAYLHQIAAGCIDDLASRGWQEADQQLLAELQTDLSAVDAAQELLKREQVAATSQRLAALNQLKKVVARIRNSARVCFMDNPNILQEFRRLH